MIKQQKNSFKKIFLWKDIFVTVLELLYADSFLKDQFLSKF